MMLGGTTQQSVNGASTFRSEGGVRFLLDGSDASRVDFDILENTYGSSKGRITRASVDAVQEFRVYASSFSASRPSARRRSKPHHEIGNQRSAWQRVRVLPQRETRYPELLQYRQQAAVSPEPVRGLGGRIPSVRTRSFFFVNYEGLRQRLGIIQNSFVPTAAFRSTLPAAMKAVVDLLPLPNGPTSTADPRLGQILRGVSNPLTEDTAAIT